MTLNQALVLIRTNLMQTSSGKVSSRPVFLACGCQPLHLATFLQAHLAECAPQNRAEVLTGLYGDLAGNLDKAAESTAISAAVIVEWNDIDPRLGLRAAAGWTENVRSDIAHSVFARLGQFADGIARLGQRMPVAVMAPTLPLPPLDSTIHAQTGLLELELDQQVSAFLVRVARLPGVRIARTPPAQTTPAGDVAPVLDPKMELLAGFPYTVPHAAAMARSLASVLWQAPPKKGLITDLDDTLWAGLVGEIGPAAVSWSHDHHSQPHGLYQQMLGQLADSGVLLAVVSKNEPDIVNQALARKDLLLDASTLFPVMASWGPKSKAVEQVLGIWNIGPDSVVFIDDNPMELDEVGQAFPQIIRLLHPGNDAAKVWHLLAQLRNLFGKPALVEEDRLRRDSIRASAVMRESAGTAGSPEFLRTLDGAVTLDWTTRHSADSRALELINKTNQFNLNGIRISEGEWRRLLDSPDTLALTTSYTDKFGRLGRIGVLVATFQQDPGPPTLLVSHWVLSCRAFSRRIEHHMLAGLLQQLEARQLPGAPDVEIRFAFDSTPRNQPIQEFLQQIGARESRTLSASKLRAACGELPHRTVTNS